MTPKQQSLALLLAMILPFALQVFLGTLFSIYPDQFLVANSEPSLPGLGWFPTVLLYGGLITYSLIVIPILSIMYVRALPQKIVVAFALEIVTLYTVFQLFPPASLAYASTLEIFVWQNIPILIAVCSAIVLKQFFGGKSSHPVQMSSIKKEA